MRNLFIFSIGPVQEFIATARRSRDLWYGSWMLSELSIAAAKSIEGLSPPGELIFPCPADKKDNVPASIFNAPNKIVAIIDGDPKTIGAAVHTAIKKQLALLWENALQNVKGGIDVKLAQKQIDDLLEFYWVSVPLQANYAEARDSAEFLFSARKGIRNFAQFKGTASPKSSLDGARETVIHKNEYPDRSDDEATKKQKAENLYKHYHARRGEQLSGVDLLKRLGSPNNAPKFKSTSDMAAIPFLMLVDRKMGNGKGKELLEKLKSLLPPERDILDGAEEGLVFENRFVDSFPSQDPRKEGYSSLLNEYAGSDKPDPYYALLAADGDNMGAAIDAQNEYEKHQQLSRALSAFASEVEGLVKTGQGVLIYAGGDDVLAYLPLHTALDIAGNLEKAFRSALENFKTADGIAPTLSVGIAVSHQLEPLADALELARTAEKEAKHVPGKNGLAIIVSKRSGADRLIKGKFDILEKRLRELIKYSEMDAISAGSAYELQNLHRELSMTGIKSEGIAAEAIRILKRKREAGSDKTVESQVLDVFQHWIEKDKIEVDALASEMIVARMFAIQAVKESI